MFSTHQQDRQKDSHNVSHLGEEWVIWLQGDGHACTSVPYHGGSGQLLLPFFNLCDEGRSGKERGEYKYESDDSAAYVIMELQHNYN